MPSPNPTLSIDFTEAEIRRFAPAIRDFYLKALISEEGRRVLAESGILANGRRFAHFLGQVGAETGGLTILRESLAYTTVARIRAVWPARSANDTDAELAKLLRNPVALGGWAYGGRMGNAKGTPGHPHPDGYDFRGGGWIQTTGREAVERYCAKLGVQVTAGALDDPLLTLRFACLEWTEKGCNALADAGDVLKISKAINLGSPNSTVKPNGMEERRAWTEKAKSLWWEREAVPAVEEDEAVASVRARVAEAAPVAPITPPVIEPAEAWGAEVQAEPEVEVSTGVSKNPALAPGHIRAAAQSPSIRSLINAKLVLIVGGIWGFFGWLWDWLTTLLNVLPLITNDVGGNIEQAEKIAKFLKLSPEQWFAISAAIIVPLIGIAVVRHTWDKLALLFFRQAQPQPEEATP